MKADILSVKNGEAVGSVDLQDSVFGAEVNEHVIYEAVKAELANQRQGTASTKERSDIVASGAKPYRQKGTGRARAGRRNSPIWVGGATVFGPSPRSYKVRLSKKIRAKAIVSLLSQKVAAGQLKVVDDFTVENGKTKEAAAVLSQVSNKNRVMLIVGDDSSLLKRAVRNIPWVRCYNANRLVYKDLFYAREVLILKSAIAGLEAQYGVSGKGE